MRIGILSFAHHHAESYIHQLRAIPGAQLLGLADDDQERGQVYAEAHRTRFFPTYEALLAEQPESYRRELLPDEVPVVGVEAARGETLRGLVGRRGL